MDSTLNTPKGLYNKYFIVNNDGTPTDLDAEYFVLKLKGSGDPIHQEACRKAILTYAKEIKEHLPELSGDIFEKYS